MSRDVMYARGDDWEAVYIDGVLASQGHSINWMHVIEELGCNAYTQEVDYEWLDEQGEFPEDMNEVVFL